VDTGEARVIKPDRDEAESFLQMLNPDHNVFTFVTADEDLRRSDSALTHTVYGSFDLLWDGLCRLNAAGAGVHVRINEPDHVRAAFVDLAGLPLPVKYNFPPSIVVETAPRRYCLYWLMHGLCPVDRFAEVQQALFECHNRSAADCDLRRVMRLPGFVAHTRMGKFRVRLVEARGGGITSP
jgi:hypothetical protein